MHCHALHNLSPIPVTEVGEIGFQTAIVEPVTVETARGYIHSAEEDDEALALCIAAARAACERFTNRTLAKRQLELRWAKLGRSLAVSSGPLGAIEKIGYVNADGNEVEFQAAEYLIEGQHSHTTAIRFKKSFVEPVDIASDISAPIFLRGTFGPDAETTGNLPADVVQAILWTTAHFFENRSPVVTGTIASELPLGVERVLGPYRHNPV